MLPSKIVPELRKPEYYCEQFSFSRRENRLAGLALLAGILNNLLAAVLNLMEYRR